MEDTWARWAYEPRLELIHATNPHAFDQVAEPGCINQIAWFLKHKDEIWKNSHAVTKKHHPFRGAACPDSVYKAKTLTDWRSMNVSTLAKYADFTATFVSLSQWTREDDIWRDYEDAPSFRLIGTHIFNETDKLNQRNLMDSQVLSRVSIRKVCFLAYVSIHECWGAAKAASILIRNWIQLPTVNPGPGQIHSVQT